MSSAGIASLALFVPAIASSAVLSARRLTRGVDNLEENPLFAVANFDIAAGQILKGGRAAKAILHCVDPNASIISEGAKNMITTNTKFGSTLKGISKGIGKVISFTADNINPIIIGAGAIKVLGSEDKADAFGREATALSCMFGAEALAKSIIGMPELGKNANGTMTVKAKEGSYKKLMDKVFTKEQNKAIADYMKTKKSMKYVTGGAKGLLFVGASIAGYKTGEKIANAVLGEKKNKIN